MGQQTNLDPVSLSGALRVALRRHEGERTALLRRYALNEVTYSILQTLANDSAKCTQIQLSRRMGINRSKMVKLLDDLCVHALVDRDRDLRDRRPNWLGPSQWGRHVYAHATKALARLESEFASMLPGLLGDCYDAAAKLPSVGSVPAMYPTADSAADNKSNSDEPVRPSPLSGYLPKLLAATLGLRPIPPYSVFVTPALSLQSHPNGALRKPESIQGPVQTPSSFGYGPEP